jgi:hypothetical protein
MLALVALPLALLAVQQQDIAARLEGRVPADIAALVTELGTAAAARGLPIDPLIQKAIEGSAKAVPADRVALAVRLVAAQLDTAAGALRSASSVLGADTVAIAAGAFAVSAGLSGGDIVQLARGGVPPADAIIGLRVAGTLVAMGVPAADAVNVVSATLQAGRPGGELLSLPGRVQAQVARGVPAAQAAAGLARAAAAQSRRGPPPGRGQPPPHPVPPQR